MTNIIDMDAYRPHCVSEVICIDCGHRYISVYPEGTWLKDLECPGCHKKGFIIKTGQDIEEEVNE